MYSIHDIAQWFLNKESMTHKKVQKLCYYAYAWYFTLFNKHLFEDSCFEAWVHGPVSPELYAKYKGNGWNHICPEFIPEIDPETIELLESVWATYGDITGNSLEALTHTELPWIKARNGCPADKLCTTIIKDEDMKSYYSSIYDGGEE